MDPRDDPISEFSGYVNFVSVGVSCFLDGEHSKDRSDSQPHARFSEMTTNADTARIIQLNIGANDMANGPSPEAISH